MYDWSPLRCLQRFRTKSFQLLLKGCTIEAVTSSSALRNEKFQLLLKGCTIEAAWRDAHPAIQKFVSVVVERMYDWSIDNISTFFSNMKFQLLLKGCTIEAASSIHTQQSTPVFQLLLKGCTIEASNSIYGSASTVQSFSCCWKDVRLKQFRAAPKSTRPRVSVVVERMYDWSSETNWLKTNDFWQLVSDLFFENGRSAQKVPLFSKIWGDLGDCLTVFDSCSNI